MAQQMNVTATRMALLQVRSRLATATRGHGLLKDKLDGMMKEFLGLLDRYKTARRAFDAEFPEVLKGFVLAGLCSAPGAVEAALEQSRSEIGLTVTTRNITGVNVPVIEPRIQSAGGYSLLQTAVEFDEAVEGLRHFVPRIIELAEMEHAVWLLIAEIERTRRRVNALEYVMIPQLREAMRTIRSKLEELERGNTVRLMKIKEMRAARQREELPARHAGVG
ncbi:MAG: V-type ATP synthase subunit D [Candidatus Brocadiaceae bacterium]|nr:V-type ATP synthase subunit D [Candidatus Brocadiaceae bacterium]